MAVWHNNFHSNEINTNYISDKNFVKNIMNFGNLENKKIPSNHKFYILTQVFFLLNFMFNKISDKFYQGINNPKLPLKIYVSNNLYLDLQAQFLMITTFFKNYSAQTF